MKIKVYRNSYREEYLLVWEKLFEKAGFIVTKDTDYLYIESKDIDCLNIESLYSYEDEKLLEDILFYFDDMFEEVIIEEEEEE